MKSVPTIIFDYRPSPGLQAVLAGVALLALMAVAGCGLALPWRGLLALLVVVYALSQGWRLRHGRWRRVAWSGEGAWRVYDADGEAHDARLRAARCLGALIALQLSVDGAPGAALVLLPDNLDAERRRLLRVRLSASADVP